jgi:hypothetical protein
MSGGMMLKKLPEIEGFEEENQDESISAKLDVITELMQKLSGGFTSRLKPKTKPMGMSVEIVEAKPGKES